MKKLLPVDIGILSALARGPVDTEGLFAQLTDTFTQKTLYRSLKYLVTAGIVTRSSKSVSLNMFWVHKMIEQASAVIQTYARYEPPQPGTARTYSFKNYHEFDAFWNDMIMKLFVKSKKPRPCIFWETHPFWWYTNTSDALLLFKRLQQFGYVPMIARAQSESVAPEIIAKIKSLQVQYSVYKDPKSRTIMKQVFDSYVLTITYPEDFLADMDTLVANAKKGSGKSTDLSKHVRTAYNTPFKVRIQNSESVAEQNYLAFKKIFVFPKNENK